MEGGGEAGWIGDWGGVLVGAGLVFPQWVACGRYCLTDAGAGEVGIGVTTLFLAFTSLCRSGIGLFSRLPPPNFWPEIN